MPDGDPMSEARADGPVGRVALALTAAAERWLPDAFVFALAATVVVFGLGVAFAHAAPVDLVDSWGQGFW
jgi:short-chain fatty acids transporter